MSPLPGQASAAIAGRNVDLTAVVDLADGDEGVLFATGTSNSGMTIFIQQGRLVVDYNALGDHTLVESDRLLESGRHELQVRLRKGDKRTGRLELVVDGETAGHIELPFLMIMMSSLGPSIGFDHGSAVSPRYRAPFAFTGTLHEIVIQANPERFPGEDAAADVAVARAEMNRQ